MRYHWSFWSPITGKNPSHVNPVGTPLLFERTYSVSAGPKCVTRLAWQHSHWIFTWQQPIRTNNQWALMRWMKKKRVVHIRNKNGRISKTTVGQGSMSKKSITNDFKPLFAKTCSCCADDDTSSTQSVVSGAYIHSSLYRVLPYFQPAQPHRTSSYSASDSGSSDKSCLGRGHSCNQKKCAGDTARCSGCILVMMNLREFEAHGPVSSSKRDVSKIVMIVKKIPTTLGLTLIEAFQLFFRFKLVLFLRFFKLFALAMRPPGHLPGGVETSCKIPYCQLQQHVRHSTRWIWVNLALLDACCTVLRFVAASMIMFSIKAPPLQMFYAPPLPLLRASVLADRGRRSGSL